MKSLLRGDWWRFVLPLMIFSLVGSINLGGCAGGEEIAEEGMFARTPEQITIDSLKNVAGMLKQRNAGLEAERRSQSARIAELETNLRIERERVKALTPPPKPKVTDAMGGYERGLSMFRNQDYEEAMEMFMALLEAGVSDDLADNVHYWLGESLYAMRNYSDAMEHFSHVFNYRVSEKKDDAQLMIANCYVRVGDNRQAEAEYQKLIDNYPTSEYVVRAREALGKLR